jgi:5-methylcytosine-specific restriction endonuclease McrA
MNDPTPMTMRAPCRYCGHALGRIETRSGQDCVFCLACGRHNYNAPRTETGRDVRSLRTRPDIKPSQRARILDRDDSRCIICHTVERALDVGHLVSVEDGRKQGLTDAELYADDNLVAMCAPCNSGYGAVSVSPRIVAALIRARIARKAAS